MARYSRAGDRVICVTCTGGEEGEIVVPEMDTPENHARLARDPRGGAAAARSRPLGPHRVPAPRLSRLGDDGHARQRDRRQPVDRGRGRGRRPPGAHRARAPTAGHRELQRLRRVRPPGPHPRRAARGAGVRAGGRRGVVPRPDRGRPRAMAAAQALRDRDGPGPSAGADGAARAAGRPDLAHPGPGRDRGAAPGAGGVPRPDAGRPGTQDDVRGRLGAGRAQARRAAGARDPDPPDRLLPRAHARRVAGVRAHRGLHARRVAAVGVRIPEDDLFAGLTAED